tara:strand:- start:887 stop:3139 length:2253 start_codon:yes stop_codon:yes gene_type:complete
MGGLAGHMSHLYDNPKLTFSKLKEIFIEAAEGRLEGTEKTDGQNLYLSFSVPSQKLDFTESGSGRAARNKGNIKAGGLSVRQVAAKFKDHPNPHLKASFSHALRAFENVIKSLPREKQVEIFGDNADIYYNAEIISPDTPNVINYDKKLVTIHRGGGGFFDKETGSEKVFDDSEDSVQNEYTRDVRKNADILASSLEDIIQNMEDNKGFEVIMDAVFNLKAIDDREALLSVLSRIDSEIASEGISEDQMIIEYVIARIGTLLKQSGIVLPADTEASVIRRLILLNPVYKKAYGYDKMPKTIEVPEEGDIDIVPRIILKDLPNRDKNKVIYIFKTHKDILKQAIQPIEHIVHDFSVKMLEGLESLFILDNKQETKRIKDQVTAAIQAIKTQGVTGNITTLLQQMEKLKSVENISTPAEGFVFDYDGYTYKFTGNFAPINQILGIGKYDGRGSLPDLAKIGKLTKEDDSIINEVLNLFLTEKPEQLEAIYLPGGFKPPHRGHWSMIEYAARKHPGVPIFIVSGQATRGGISLEKASRIWNIYIEESGLSNVELIGVSEPIERTDKNGNPKINKDGSISTSTNPWDWIKTNVPENYNNIAIVYSEKDKNYDAIADAQLGEFENLSVMPIQVPVCPDEDRQCALSATNFRDTIQSGNKDEFLAFIPEFVLDRSDEIWDLFHPDHENDTTDLSELIMNLVSEVEEERLYKKELEEMSSVGASAIAGAMNSAPSVSQKRPSVKGINVFLKKQASSN